MKSSTVIQDSRLSEAGSIYIKVRKRWLRADLLKSARQKLLVNATKHKLLVEAWTRWSNKGWEAFRRPWFESHSTTHSAKKRCSNPNEKEIVGNQPLAKLSQSKVEDEKHFYFSCLFC